MKYKITDENGKKFEIDEIPEEKPAEEEKPVEPKEETHDAELTAEEISALKELAAMAPKLKDLLKVEAEEHNEQDIVDENKPEEEVVDTCKDAVASKNSKVASAAGSTEKRMTNDSVDDIDGALEIENTWAKRYNK